MRVYFQSKEESDTVNPLIADNTTSQSQKHEDVKWYFRVDLEKIHSFYKSYPTPNKCGTILLGLEIQVAFCHFPDNQFIEPF